MYTRRELLKHTAVGLTLDTTLTMARAAQTGATSRVPNQTRSGTCMVQTVLGPIDVAKLGFTLTHEHICRNASVQYGGREKSAVKAVDKLREARDEGIDTIIDVTPFDVGRDVRFGQEVSKRSGMQIVACTGQHLSAPESYNSRTVEEITELFIKEIEQGIDGTDIKAGVIKVASGSAGMTTAEESVFTAAARASKATGIPIGTHTNARRRGGDKQAAVFEREGLSPARAALGHSNDSDEMEYLTGLVKRGYTLGMDHAFWGLAPEAALSWQKRVECIKQLIDGGFVNQLFLSNDWVLGDFARDKVNPDGLLYTTRKTIPYLLELGVSQQAIHTMTVENPRRFLSRC